MKKYKTMKHPRIAYGMIGVPVVKYLKFFIGCIACFFLLGCDKFGQRFGDKECSLEFNNNAEYEVVVYSPLLGFLKNYDPIYPDTILPLEKPDEVFNVDGRKWKYLCYSCRRPLSDIYSSCKTDTLSFLIFSADTLNTYCWDSVRTKYKVVQRYDVTLSDIYVNDFPTFPPTEEMRNIKMWPPYGTYDENGHRVKP